MDALENVPLIKGDNVTVPLFKEKFTFQIVGITPAPGTNQAVR
jgi:transitional endoplasmic reticulum ATPase